jgi:hypothetical protein
VGRVAELGSLAAHIYEISEPKKTMKKNTTDKLPVEFTRTTKGEDDKNKKKSSPEEFVSDKFLSAYEDYVRDLEDEDQKSGNRELELELLRIKGWPEFKKTTVKKCKKVLGKKVCINWPQLWKRESRLSVFLVVSYPSELENDVKECLNTALTAAILALLASGNFAGAWALFVSLLEACLTAKGADAIGRIGGKFELRKVEGDWRKI